MSFTNSSMVNYIKLSPNCTMPRNQSIKKITIHHTAGVLSIEAMGEWLAKTTTKASSNYGIGGDGRVALYVEEKNRAWTSSSAANDHQAVTYEVCNSTGAPKWEVSDKALERVIALSVDVCLRNPDICQINGKRGLTWTGDSKGSLTIHKFFANTNCPGPYLEPKMGWIAQEVNKRLDLALGVQTPENQNEEKLEEDFLMNPNKMTDAQVDELLARIAVRLEKKGVSEYAKEAAQKGITSGLFADGDSDGLIDNPQSFLTRQDMAVVLNRAGILDR